MPFGNRPHAGTYQLPTANTICIYAKERKQFSAAYKDVSARDPKPQRCGNQCLQFQLTPHWSRPLTDLYLYWVTWENSRHPLLPQCGLPRAGLHSQAVPAHLVQTPRGLGQV